MDEDMSSAKGTDMSSRDAASPALPQDQQTDATGNPIQDSNRASPFEEPSERRARQKSRGPADISKRIRKTLSTATLRKTAQKTASMISDKAKGVVKKYDTSPATSASESPVPPVTASPYLQVPTNDARNTPYLQQSSTHLPPDGSSPWQRDKPDFDEQHMEADTAKEKESLPLNDDDDSSEDSGDGGEEDQNAPKLSNLARYFWSRLDVAKELFDDDRDDECRELVLETLMRGMVPLACRCELLHVLACVMPWEQAQGCLDEADELCNEMEKLVPYSKLVTELRTQGTNLRQAVKEYHECPDDNTSAEDEMDDLAKGVEDLVTDPTEEGPNRRGFMRPPVVTTESGLATPEGTPLPESGDEDEEMRDVGH